MRKEVLVPLSALSVCVLIIQMCVLSKRMNYTLHVDMAKN